MRKLFLALAAFTSLNAFGYISISPNSVYFGDVNVNSYGPTQYVNVYNYDNKEVRVYISGYCGSDFDIYHYSCYTLRPNGSCSISVQFSPRNEGYQSCTLSVSSDNGFASLWITGTGVRR